jgi:ubiquinone/menaquinone biosynthesis C-methylase UbiE
MSQPQSSPPPNPAQIYEDYFIAGGFWQWAEETVDRARPQPGERVLDIACGTGIIARTVARRLAGNARVVGLDISPAMLAVARSSAEREGVQVEWIEGNSESLPFLDESFDLAISQQGLQFVQDRAAAMAEMLRIIEPGGRAVTSTWTEIGNNSIYEPFTEVVERHLGTSAIRSPFSLYSQDLLQSLFAGAGFKQIEIERVRRTVRLPSPPSFVDHGVAAAAAAVPGIQAMDAAQQADLVEAIRADMVAPLQTFSDGDELLLKMETQITTARKPGSRDERNASPT